MNQLILFIKNSITNHICGNYFNLLKPTTTKIIVPLYYKACLFKITLNKVAVKDGLITLAFSLITENNFKVFDWSNLEDKQVKIKNINPFLWNIIFSPTSLKTCAEFISQHYNYTYKTSEENLEIMTKMNNIANKQGMLFKSIVDKDYFKFF